ncbi:zinc knuckle domain-containing protein [Ditylenchus destructor]|nr:zinc knuckle domain-containing protein [Ditylenchus destructor]
MSNANFTPLGTNRRWTKDQNDPSSSDTFGTSRIDEKGSFVDTSGEVLVKPPVTGACRKCGFTGHLAYQCRNFIQLKPNQETQIDISSTSSEEYETPLKNTKQDKHKKKEEKRMKKLKKRLKKELAKEKKLKKRKHADLRQVPHQALHEMSTNQPVKAKPAPKSQPYSPLQARTIEKSVREPTKTQSTSSVSKPRENCQNTGRNLSRTNNSSAIETHTWDREWDSGKLPVENWKMNVPDIGDSAQSSRHFRPLTTHRYGSNPLRRRGGGLFSMSAARPSATAHFRPLRNPGFFHDDRFDDIVEGVTKDTVPKSTPPNTSSTSKALDTDLPEAVRGKKIAARLSVVNKQNDSPAKAAHRPQRPQLPPIPLASALRSSSSQFSHRRTDNRLMKNDLDNPMHPPTRKTRNSEAIVSAQIRHPKNMSNVTGRKQNPVGKNKTTDEKISKENTEKAARENKNSERQRRMPKTRPSAQPWRIANKGQLMSNNSDENTEIRLLLDNLLDQICTEIDGMKVEVDSSNNKSQDASGQNENSKTSDETEV